MVKIMSFSERLKEERKRLKVTQKNLAADLQITEQAQNAYEKGKLPQFAEYLEKLAERGFDVGYLVSGVHSGVDPISPDDRRLLDLFRNATPAMQQAALVLLATGSGMGGTNINISGSGVSNVATGGGTVIVDGAKPTRRKKA